MSEGKCTNPDCNAPDLPCPDGFNNLQKCEFWTKANSADNTPATIAEQPKSTIFWTGNALGQIDLKDLVPRARHLLIGVLGAYDAGKTTLLAANYLQFLEGKQLGAMQFAGSKSLQAWESISACMRLDNAAKSATFPRHTPRGVERTPGLLHLALRNEIDEFRDVLLTDAPGEWFADWAINEDSSEAVGAQWIAQYADAFLVIADCEKLSAKNPGAARKALRSLIERLANHALQRPVILVWTKNELEYMVPAPIQEAIRETLNESIPGAFEMRTTITEPESFLAVLQTAIETVWHAKNAASVSEPVIAFDPFFAYRGSHYAT